MNLGLAEKHVLVTGSTRGIGRATADLFLAEGARVTVNSRTADSVAAAVGELVARFGRDRVHGVAADVTHLDRLDGLLDSAVGAFGPVDVLVTNFDPPAAGDFGELTARNWFRAWEGQIMNCAELVDRVVPAMRAREWGRVINIRSTVAREPHRKLSYPLQNTTAPASLGLFKTYAMQLAPFGITVNSVLPGGFDTDMRRKAMELWPDGLAEDDVPMQRPGDPAELGAAVVFLASAQASYITGVSLAVDGGKSHAVFS